MIHVERYYQQKEWLTRKVMKKRVYLATDDPKIFAEAFKKFVFFFFSPIITCNISITPETVVHKML